MTRYVSPTTGMLITANAQYDLFGGPVNPEDFPDYLDIVGGEDNMMDLGTMQQKVDDGDYRNMDGFEVRHGSN